MCWLLILFIALAGLHQAEALSIWLGLATSEIRYAIGGLLLGLPVALAISALEERLASTHQRFSRY